MDHSRTHTITSVMSSTPDSIEIGRLRHDEPLPSPPPVPKRVNPFASALASPITTRPPSVTAASTTTALPPPAKFFHSRRVKRSEQEEKPWTGEKKTKTERAAGIIPWLAFVFGIGVTGFMIYEGMSTIANNSYCPVLMDDFSGGLNPKYWTKEAEVGGYGNGQFEQTTNTDENVFIQDGQLVIKPTLQDANLINTNNVINLLKSGDCSAKDWASCVTSTNTTNGTIVNPVKSGRVSTRLGPSIRYGRIEVEAKFPSGDWLWPAIWMLPVNSTYGDWPASGEIDIAEGRGNNYTYPMGGSNVMSSTLHFGPDPGQDAWWRTHNVRYALKSSWADKFHTYGLEWTEKYLYTYIDSRLGQVIYRKFTQPLWQVGQFPPSTFNGSRLVDPWSQTGRDSTPFDQDFYLIMNVAVGGTNGWFQDGEAGKPWVDASPTAKKDFWNAQDQWYPTWQKEGASEMIIKSVKMYQMAGYNGCTNGQKIKR